MHVNNGFSVGVFGFGMDGAGRSGNVLICDEPRPDCALVPALSNLVLKLCGATTQTALLSPAVVFSFKGKTRCVLVYVIKTEATSHSEENSTLCSHRFNALIKELKQDGPVPA